jgi:hypothetical protein
LLSSKNEELPGRNCRNKEGALVPSMNLMHAIRVIPFFLLKIVLHDVVELHFRVPSTIDENLAITGKSRVTTSTFRCIVVWNDLLPSLSF